MSVQCYEFNLPDVSAADPEAWATVEADLYASLRAPQLRLLSYVHPIDADEFEAVRRAHMALQKTDMGRRFVEQEARMLALALRQEAAWSMRHYLLVWGRPLRALSRYLVENAYPPDPLVASPTNYVERVQHLHPKTSGLPYVCLLGSYHFQRDSVWTWDYPWADLLTHADGPMLVCLDAVRVSEERLRLMRRGLEAQAKVNQDRDMALMAARAEAALQSGEEAYEMRLLLLLSDAKLDRLTKRAERIRNAYEGHFGLSRMDGQQWAALEFFSAKQSPSIGQKSVASAHSLVLGSALPVCFGGLGGVINRVNPRGTYIGFRFGLNDQSLGPIHWQLFTESNRAAHVGILGQIGSGKTVSMSALLARYRATEGYPIVMLEPLGNAKKLAALLEGRDRGLRYHLLDWSNLRLNPLDWIPESLNVDEGLGEQEAHLDSILSVMLGRPLTNLEKGFLAQALLVVYRGLTPTQLENPAHSPLLADLCEVLDSYRLNRFGEHAEKLAVEIAGKFVAGGLSRNFNTHTALPMTFDGADLFDVAAIVGTDSGQQAIQQLVYYSIFSGYLRVARRDRRNGKRVRRIFAVDEYFRMARSEYLRNRLVDMVKTMRNLYTSVWIAEQNLSELAKDQSLVANLPHWLVFKQEPLESRHAPEVFGRQRFPQDYTKLLPRLGQGNCVALLDEATQLLKINLLPMEMDALVKESKTYGLPTQSTQTARSGRERQPESGDGRSAPPRREATPVS